jgi:hypothetical protein
MRKVLLFIVSLICLQAVNAFAAVNVNPGTGGTNICSIRAATGSAPAYNTLGTITFFETNQADITVGPHTLVLSAPAGWQFNTLATPTLNFTGGRNITAVTFAGMTTTTMTINVTTSGTTLFDVFSIANVQVQATTTGSAAGNINPTSSVGMTGLMSTANVGSLSLLAAVAPSVTVAQTPAGAICAGTSVTFTATPVNGGAPTYQWSLNGTPVAGATNTTYVNSTLANGNTVVVRMTATGCVTTPTVNSTTTTMTVNPIPAALTGVFTVCPTGNTTLSSTTPGGVWTSTAPAFATVASGVVTGVIAGNSTISYSVLGCVTSAIVTVNTAPAAFSITGGGSFCASSTTGLPVGLSGSAAGISYTAYNGASSVATVGGTGSVISFGSFTTAATYTVLATNLANTCSTPMIGSATILVTAPVTPSVTLVAPTAALCDGTSASFSSTTVNGGPTPAYQWLVNSVAAGTGATFSYVPVSGDIVSVVLTPGGICTDPASVSDDYTVTTTPIATPGITISVGPSNPSCLGSLVYFSSVPSFGGTAPTYTWTKNGVNVATGPAYSYIPVEGDVVYCSFNSNYVCRTADTATSSTITMHTQASAPLPVVNVIATPGTNVPAGTSVTLTAAVTGTTVAVSYQWLVNGTPIPGATLASFTSNTFADGDIVTCQVTNNDPCAKFTLKSVKFTDPTFVGGPLGTEAVAFSMMPNPNSGTFTVKGSVSANEPVTMRVNNVLGQNVYTNTTIAKGGAVEEQVSLQHIPAGIYFLSINAGTETQTIHFVVK